MPYISDTQLFKAVSFASSLIKKGTSAGLAAYKSANYYGVDTSLVASELGKRKSVKEKNRYKSFLRKKNGVDKSHRQFTSI